MRTLHLGGSFNPIHHGHLLCARAAAEAAGFDRVVLVPTGQQPYKVGAPDYASAADRLTMCRIAVDGVPGFQVDDIEIHRPGHSYTIDTVREMRRRGASEVAWLIGADAVVQMPMWHRANELLEEAVFVVMARPGWTIDWEALPAPFRKLRQAVVPVPALDISATAIRRRVAAGLPIDYLTPSGVVEHIRKNGLYRTNG